MPATIDPTTTERALPVDLRADDKPREWWLHWILRIAAASTFIGHGAFGIRGKEAWLEYYAIFGIPPGLGTDLMPLTGAVDIALGLLVLFVPMRSVLLYMAFWGLFTATLRPLAGQGVFELLERSYNFGPALALLLLHGWGHSLREWFSPLRSVPRLPRDRARSFALGFRVMIAAYLIAHGALAVVMAKPLLLDLYGSIGVGDAATLNDIAGLFEIGLGALLLWGWAAATPVLLFVVAWKLGTESLYIADGVAGAGWEVIERGGSYAAPLALICLNAIVDRPEPRRRRGSRSQAQPRTPSAPRTAGDSVRYRATLLPVPHDRSADGGSFATAKAKLELHGKTLSVKLKARGLSPDLPHAAHIHGKNHPEIATCPGADRRVGGVSDSLIETVDGIADYGPILVPFTTSGDTSPDSGLALARMPVAQDNGKFTFERDIPVPSEVADHLDEKHIVIHGHDIDGDGGYDPGPITALGAPLEAELPVACGEIRSR